MKVTAHRGVSSLAPENTLAAFKKTAEMGYQWIEIDVQLSCDLIPVVIHDQSVDRCTNGTGFVAELTLQNLQSLNAGSWFSEAFKNEQIPTLEQTLLLARENNLKVNIEIKLYPEDNIELLCEKIKDVIVSLNINKNQLLFSSFDLTALKKMQALLPQIPRGLLWSAMPDNGIDLLKETGAYSAHCDYRFLTAQQALKIKKAGYEICCFTPNTPDEVNEYWSWGVDMMITDCPQAYISYNEQILNYA